MSRKQRTVLPGAAWAQIQAEYEAGVPAKHLSEHYQVSLATIYKRKNKHKWEREARVISDDMLSKAREETEQRLVEHMKKTEVDMKQIIDTHKGISQQIMDMATRLLASIDGIPDTEVSKKAHALKTLSDVITAQIRNERKTWSIDEKGADTSLEALLDELDEEEDKRAKVMKPVVVQ